MKLENRRLTTEISDIKENLKREIALLEEMKVDAVLPMTKKRYLHQMNLLMQLKAVPAKIIYRSPAFWDQCCWINVGEQTNEALGIAIVSKNSPVVVGDSIVGVVDEVGPQQSRVRLLTDSELTPSVRVLRNGQYLAKGEIHGSGRPLWRGKSGLLKGIGFNYDFDDEEGPGRDLRTGKASKSDREIPLIHPRDLLVTTGMDGVFPPNFRVAEVVEVYPLEEGDYSYEIEAKPSAGNLDDLTRVFVLPAY